MSCYFLSGDDVLSNGLVFACSGQLFLFAAARDLQGMHAMWKTLVLYSQSPRNVD